MERIASERFYPYRLKDFGSQEAVRKDTVSPCVNPSRLDWADPEKVFSFPKMPRKTP
jgi:hypothetical protein